MPENTSDSVEQPEDPESIHRDALHRALENIVVTAKLIKDAENGEDEELRVLLYEVADVLFEDGVPRFAYRYPARPHLAFLAATSSFAAVSLQSSSVIYCKTPTGAATTCDLILTPRGTPHFRCKHSPAHCYSMSGASITCP